MEIAVFHYTLRNEVVLRWNVDFPTVRFRVWFRCQPFGTVHWTARSARWQNRERLVKNARFFFSIHIKYICHSLLEKGLIPLRKSICTGWHGPKLFAMIKFSACQRIILGHDSVRSWTKWIFMDPYLSDDVLPSMHDWDALALYHTNTTFNDPV